MKAPFLAAPAAPFFAPLPFASSAFLLLPPEVGEGSTWSRANSGTSNEEKLQKLLVFYRLYMWDEVFGLQLPFTTTVYPAPWGLP